MTSYSNRSTTEILGDIDRQITQLMVDLSTYSFRMAQDQKGIAASDMLKQLRMYSYVVKGMQATPNVYGFNELNPGVPQENRKPQPTDAFSLGADFLDDDE